MQIIAYSPVYQTSVEAVCLATASERARTDPTHRTFTLNMYCEEYLAHERALILEDSGRAHGYVLCADNFESWMEHAAPYHKRIRELGPVYAERLARECAVYERHADRFPAHLHIDIEPGLTGGGWGGRLLDQLIADLAHDGIPGIMLGVSATNTAAIRFYERHGFKAIESNELSVTMGCTIEAALQ